MEGEKETAAVEPSAESVAAPAKVTVPGAFMESLIRTNKKIRADRAEAIAESAQMLYRRKVEDLEIVLKKKRRERENMLDMSPDNAMSLVPAKDFRADEFVQRDSQLSVDIRNLEIELDIAKARYAYLFGGV